MKHESTAQRTVDTIWQLSDFDGCECGDYRKDHKDGAGRCCMPDDMTHDFQPCLKFRFAKAATEIPAPYKALQARAGQ